jgi:chaperonin GroES
VDDTLTFFFDQNLPKFSCFVGGTIDDKRGTTALLYERFVKTQLTKLKSNDMSVNVKPIADRVIVEPSAAETTTASGIIIPDTAKEKPQRGTIVAVGNGKKDEPMTVKTGDVVLYGKYAGTEITIEGKEYLIMREADIFAII